jgi:hypothetical protein
MLTYYLLSGEKRIIPALFLLQAFPLELLAAQFMFAYSAPRRGRFRSRVALVCAFAVLWYLFMSPQIAGKDWAALIYFCAFFALSLLAILFCFRIKTGDLLYRCSAGYITQNIAINLSRAFAPIGGLLGAASGEAVFVAAHILVFPAVYACMYFALARRLNGDVKSKPETRPAIIFAALTVFATVFSNIFLGGEGLMGMFASISIIVFLEILILLVQFELLMYDGAKQDLLKIEQLWNQDRALYGMGKANLDALNIHLHDLKHILAIGEDKLTGDVKAEIENAIKNYGMIADTGRDALDVVLTEKKARCVAGGIELSVIADGGKLKFMSTPDIYSLFGNILDNAIESAGKIEDRALRVIYLTVREDGDALTVRAENYFDSALRFQDGALRSTKQEEGLHGYGVKSVALLAKKYGGEFSIEINDNLFALNLRFDVLNNLLLSHSRRNNGVLGHIS